MMKMKRNQLSLFVAGRKRNWTIILASAALGTVCSGLLANPNQANAQSNVQKISETKSTTTTSGAGVTTSPVAAPAASPTSSSASASVAPLMTPSTSGVFPATSRQQALNSARQSAGRSDPLAPISGFKPFPTGAEFPKTIEKEKTGMSLPPSFNKLPPSAGEGLVPPPPPVSGSLSDELPVSELPLPPDKPSIVTKLKLTGIIGGKAIFTITDKEAIRQNKWPGYLIMGDGDKFESIEALTVGTDSVVLEENGERSTKTLERIR